jgi:hypothetical protein
MIPPAVPSSRRVSCRSSCARLAVALTLLAAGCAATPTRPASPLRLPREPLVLRLEEPTDWRRFAVERRSFSRALTFHEPATGRTWRVPTKGRPSGWMHPLNIVVPAEVYERSLHRGRFRFAHPLSGEPIVLRARATSQSVRSVPLPAVEWPRVEITSGEEERERGHLAYDQYSLVLFAGELDGQGVEIVQLGEGVRRARGPLEVLVAAFPLAGEFAVRFDGREVARFVKQPQRGTVTEFELALRAAEPPAVEENAVLAFMVFALVESLVESSVG